MCERPGPAPCAGCLATLRPAPSLAVPTGLVACRVLLAYDGPGRDLVARLKYRNACSVLPWLAAGMAALTVAVGDEVDVVTWAPTTAQRRRERGFDQAELLARRVAASSGARRWRCCSAGPGHTRRVCGWPSARPVRASGPGVPRAARSHAATSCWSTTSSRRGRRSPRASRVLADAGAAAVVGLAAARTAPPCARAP